MKIYKLNLDVDNYQGCFINETNLLYVCSQI